MFSRILWNNCAIKTTNESSIYFCAEKNSQENTLLKTIQLIITVSRSRKSRCMPCDDFCFIWLRGASNVARDMRCCDSGTSVSRILILSFYYCIQHRVFTWQPSSLVCLHTFGSLTCIWSPSKGKSNVTSLSSIPWEYRQPLEVLGSTGM